MFTPEELEKCLDAEWLLSGYSELERSLLRSRLGQKPEDFEQKLITPLNFFTSAVLSSVGMWDDLQLNPASKLCNTAADIEAGLAFVSSNDGKSFHRHVFRAAILYELAGMPGTSATFIKKNGLDTGIKSFFSREGLSPWGRLQRDPLTAVQVQEQFPYLCKTNDSCQIFEMALGDFLLEYGFATQRGVNVDNIAKDFKSFIKLATQYDFGVSSDELSSIQRILENRKNHSSIKSLKKHSALSQDSIRKLGAPSEFWPVQAIAVERGLLSLEKQSYGLAAPTGTGKTSLTKILIADYLKKEPEKKVIYIAPSRALVAQVSNELKETLGELGIKVLSLGSHLTIHAELVPLPDDYDVLIFTPERADLLMRVDPIFMHSVGLVVVDEAHHIEQEERGILLELYLWRLRRIIPQDSRIVQLSAVAPNIDDLASWLSSPEKVTSTKVDWRTNRLRLGTFELMSNQSGVVKFENQKPFILLESEEVPADSDEGLAVLANKLSKSGIVLVLATSPARAEILANLISDLREGDIPQGEEDFISERLDAWAERELHKSAGLRKNYKNRVVYHHAQLPPRVRYAVEDVISDKRVDIVCATTTLAEGVNFPFSTVLVESLVGKKYEISPRSLWNIAGRAGRFGVDTEGHCILYRPQLWADRLKHFKLQDYLTTRLDGIPPVRSALADAIVNLSDYTEKNDFDFDKLDNVDLSKISEDVDHKKEELKKVRSLINLIRVGYTHAHFSKIIEIETAEADEFEGQFFASRQLSDNHKKFAKKVAAQQKKVIHTVFLNDPEYLRIAAKIGWSLEVQMKLSHWLSAAQDWQLEQFGNFVVGGYLRDPDKLGYLLGPVTKNMAEFGGDALGGLTSFIAGEWIKGIPLSDAGENVSGKLGKKLDFNELIRIVYGKLQYMLPWALFGTNELLHYEAERRGIAVQDGVAALSALAAEGVPSFDALRLVTDLNIERVDAARLAASYKRASAETDVVSWFKSREWNTVVGIVRGIDKRRLDPELRRIWEKQSQH